MIKFSLKGKKVYYVYPFASNNMRESTIVYPFNDNDIKTVVSADIGCGNYRIGKITDSDLFMPFYVGRVTGGNLRDRLIEHIAEYGTDEIYFNFEIASSVLEAYEKECHDYHSFLDGNGYLRNKIHPAKPDKLNTKCPICGQ